VRAFVERYSIGYPVRLATDDVIRAFFGDGARVTLPATFVFDAAGALRGSFLREVNRTDVDALLKP
jgi:hypothetical protein